MAFFEKRFLTQFFVPKRCFGEQKGATTPPSGSKMVKNGDLVRNGDECEIDEVATGQIVCRAIEENLAFRVDVAV